MSVPNALIERAAAGDENALSEALLLAAPRVRAIIEPAIPRKWQSVLATDDVMQQAYSDAFVGIRGFTWRGDGSFEAWLTTLAKRTLLDTIRMLEADKRGGQRRQLPLNADASAAGLIEVLVPAQSRTPSRAAAAGEAIQLLHRAIATLPPPQRTVVEQFDLAGHEAAAVAAELGRSVGAVYMLRSRAHAHLTAWFEANSASGQPGS